MTFLLGPMSRVRCLVCLLLASSLQVALVGCQNISAMQGGSVTSPEEYTCTPKCSAGYECELGRCTRQDCTKLANCSEVVVELVCGSDGTTYNNLCEMERARCELEYDIKLLYQGPCITASPPPDQNCSAHQARFDANDLNIVERCNLEKYVSGTLDQNELKNCYRPQCNPHSDKYYMKQCTVFHTPQWCWCSTPDGQAIQGTFQKNMPSGYCSNQRKCMVDGKTHEDGAVFTTSDICGLCECSNGTHTCFVEFNVDSDGRLSNDSLENLKKDLIQVFNFQYNHQGHIQIDIRHVYKYPIQVSDSQKEVILGWKFQHYDINQDHEISTAEEYNFHSELRGLFQCNKYFDHLSELIDENGDNEITMEEWKDFFHTPGETNNVEVSEESSQPVKREAVPVDPRKPLHLRKKFHYILH